MKTTILSLLSLLFVGLLAAPNTSLGQSSGPDPSTLRSAADLQELLAPVALYPDPLISLVLPASTTPSDIVMANRYISSGGDAEALDNQPWDDSVKGLCRYADTLAWLDENLAWTTQLGDAFAAQPEDVMQAIQVLRAKAQAQGNLRNTPEQTIVSEPAPPPQVVVEGQPEVVYQQVIRIVPAQPDYIYEPRYDPETVYYQPAALDDPPVYFGEPYYAGPWLGFDFDWHHHHLYRGDWHRGWNYERDWDRYRDNDRDRDGGRRMRNRESDVFVNNSLSNTQQWSVNKKRRPESNFSAGVGRNSGNTRPGSIAGLPFNGNKGAHNKPIKPVVKPTVITKTNGFKPGSQTVPPVLGTGNQFTGPGKGDGTKGNGFTGPGKGDGTKGPGTGIGKGPGTGGFLSGKVRPNNNGGATTGGNFGKGKPNGGAPGGNNNNNTAGSAGGIVKPSGNAPGMGGDGTGGKGNKGTPGSFTGGKFKPGNNPSGGGNTSPTGIVKPTTPAPGTMIGADTGKGNKGSFDTSGKGNKGGVSGISPGKTKPSGNGGGVAGSSGVIKPSTPAPGSGGVPGADMGKSNKGSNAGNENSGGSKFGNKGSSVISPGKMKPSGNGGSDRPKGQPEPQPQVKPKSQPQPEPQSKPKFKGGDSQPQMKPRSQPQPEPQSKPKPKGDSQQKQPQSQPKPQPKPEPKPQPKQQSQPKPQPKPEPKPQPKAQSAPQSKPQPQSQPKGKDSKDDDKKKKKN